MKAVKEESRVRHHFHFIQMMETLNRLFLTGKSSEAVHRFDKYRDSLMFCLRDAVSCNQTYSRAFEAFTHMNIFLDTIFWADPALGKQLYDNFLKRSTEKKGHKSSIYASFLLSKAFGYLHWSSSNTDKLLSEASEIIEELSSVPSLVKGKLFCYLGFRRLIMYQREEGILLLEKCVS